MNKDNFIVISATCSNAMFEYLSNIKYKNIINPSQKYFKLLLEGMTNHRNVSINCVSIRTINPSTSNTRLLKANQDRENGVNYFYVKIRNRKFINYFDMIKNAYCQSNKIIKRNQGQTYLLCDALSICGVLVTLLLAKMKRLKSCAIVTDLPNFVTAINKEGRPSNFRLLKDKFLSMLLTKFDYYCFITESMNIINKKQMPYTIVEGIATDNNSSLHFINDNDDFIIMYAGGLYEKFGVKKLIDAIDYLTDKKIKLYLYGEGDLVDYINHKSRLDSRIQYRGIKSSQEIFELEKQASLLINCRPTGDEFTKYSFPSKIIEYMSSGTPVLTTRLAGIPGEYYPYLFFIDKSDENALGIASRINEIYQNDHEAMNEFGLRAKKYVQFNKNKTFQGGKIIKLMRKNQ